MHPINHLQNNVLSYIPQSSRSRVKMRTSLLRGHCTSKGHVTRFSTLHMRTSRSKASPSAHVICVDALLKQRTNCEHSLTTGTSMKTTSGQAKQSASFRLPQRRLIESNSSPLGHCVKSGCPLKQWKYVEQSCVLRTNVLWAWPLQMFWAAAWPAIMAKMVK